MGKIESLLTARYDNLNLLRLNMTDSRSKFAAGFDELCCWLSPELSIDELDLRHYGDAMYSMAEYLKREKRENSLLLRIHLKFHMYCPINEFEVCINFLSYYYTATLSVCLQLRLASQKNILIVLRRNLHNNCLFSKAECSSRKLTPLSRQIT
jgi:hypothetical protein